MDNPNENLPPVEPPASEPLPPAAPEPPALPSPAMVMTPPAPPPAPELPPAPEAPDGAPTSDERLFAAVAHAGGVLNLVTGGFGGMIVAALVWLLNYQRFRWAAFHGLQALVFQVASLLVLLGAVLLGVPVIIACSLLSLGLAAPLLVPLVVLVALGVQFGSVLYGIYGALEVYNGRDFRYAWVGDWLARQWGMPSMPARAPEAPSSGGAPAAGGAAGIGVVVLAVLLVCGILAACLVVALIFGAGIAIFETARVVPTPSIFPMPTAPGR